MIEDLPVGREKLTPRERECLQLVLENWSSKEIARQLGISHTSVDTHIRRARAKLGLKDRFVAALAAQGTGPSTDPPTLAAAAAPPSDFPSLFPFLDGRDPWVRVGMVPLVATGLAFLFAVIVEVIRLL